MVTVFCFKNKKITCLLLFLFFEKKNKNNSKNNNNNNFHIIDKKQGVFVSFFKPILCYKKNKEIRETFGFLIFFCSKKHKNTKFRNQKQFSNTIKIVFFVFQKLFKIGT